MEAHNFNILETKIRQAIEEIKTLKINNDELRVKLNESNNGEATTVSGIDDKKHKLLLTKVEDMLEALDKL